MDFMKSASKIGAFCILLVCSVYAFYDNSFPALQLGVMAFVLLVGTKTGIAGLVDTVAKKAVVKK